MSEHQSDYRPINLPPNRRGRPAYSTADPTMCSPPGPSPDVRRYTRCPKDCDCLKCRTERADLERIRLECRTFAMQASHAPKAQGYRSVRRAG